MPGEQAQITQPRSTHARSAACAALLALVLAACAPNYVADRGALGMMARGEFGRARFELDKQADDGDDLDRLLRWEKAAVAALLDGLPDAAAPRLDRIYDRLRTQGVNEGRNASSIFVSEAGVRSWKGEPFEQAMMYAYIAIHDAQAGDFGNARAAAGDSLFTLRDFSDGSGVVSVEDLARAGAGDDAETLARRVDSDFVYGQLLAGFAAARVGMQAEADERFLAARALRPDLATLADALRAGEFDALLIVEHGLGPERYATGDGVYASYRARTPSDSSPLRVRDAGGESAWPQVADLNTMANDHRWRSLDDIRAAKQAFGQALMLSGAAVMSQADNAVEVLVGAGAAAVGAIAQSNSRADTRHNELLPQRVYLAPVRVRDDSTAELSLGPSRLVVTGLTRRAGARQPPIVRLVRMPEGPPPDWATSGAVLYANDQTGPLDQPTLPAVLGGRDARTPRPELMPEWRAAGLPDRVGFEQVIEAYRREGVEILTGPDRARARGHVLEGGSTLFTPLAGSAGFTRLYGQVRPYTQRSDFARALAAEVQRGAAGTVEGSDR